MKWVTRRILQNLLATVLAAGNALAADRLTIGDLDPSFGAGLERVPGSVYALEASPDGGFFVAGWFDRVNGEHHDGLLKFLSNGAIDHSFTNSFGNNPGVIKMVVVPGGMIVAMAYNLPGSGLVRLHPDGRLDEGFATPAGLVFADFVTTPTGRIYVIYREWHEQAYELGFRIGRLTSGGNLDPTFDFLHRVQGTGGDWDWYHLPSEKFVGLRALLPEGGSSANLSPQLFRLNEDGSMDASFSVQEIYNGGSITFLSDERILVRNSSSGNWPGRAGLTNTVAAYLPDGTFDHTFVPEVSTNFFTWRMQPLESGGVMLAGASQLFPPVVKLKADGSLEESFEAQIDSLVPALCCIVLEDGSVVGPILDPDASTDLVKLTPSGEVDDALGIELKAQPIITRVLPAPGGSWIVHGQLQFESGAEGRLARLNADGNLDAVLLDHPSQLIDLSVLEDGSVVFLGDGNGLPSFGRVLPTGGLDLNYHEGIISSHYFVNTVQHRIARRSDGKVLVALGSGGVGDPEEGFAQIETPIVMLNDDGSADLSFVLTNVFGPSDSYSILIQRDDRILLSGIFESPEGGVMPSLVRLLPNGDLDESFSLPAGHDIRRLLAALQPDGRILLAQRFDYGAAPLPDPAPDEPLIRLNPDGSIDESFNTPFARSTWWNGSVVVQADGRLLVCGELINRQGEVLGGIVRLESDGSIDPTFAKVSAAMPSAIHAAVQGDGRVLIAGFFSSTLQTEAMGLARFESVERPRLDLLVGDVGALVLTGNTNRVFAIDSNTEPAGWEFHSTVTNVTGELMVPLEGTAEPRRFFRARFVESDEP